MKKLQHLLVWALALNVLLSPAVFAEETPAVTASGYVGAVSNYVWRGVPQNAGATSVQGELSFNFAAVEGLSIGMWVASIGGTDLPANESDYLLSYSFESGDIEYSLGVTLYSYDFNAFNANAGTQNELFFGISGGSFSGTVYMIPAEDSTLGAGTDSLKGESLNWLELGYSGEFAGLEASLTYGIGTYNQQWLNAGNTVESTSIVTVNLVKALKEGHSVSFNGTYVAGQSKLGTEMKNEFWMSYDVSY